jgi:hypothetical protein
MSSLLLYADICWKFTSLAIIFYDAFTLNTQLHILLLTIHFLASVRILPKSQVTRMPFCLVPFFFMLIFLNPDSAQDVPLNV